MGRGLIASLFIHLGLLTWVLVGVSFSRPAPLKPAEDPIEVSTLSKAALETMQRQGDLNSKIEEQASTSKPSPIVAEKEVPKPKAADPAPPATPPPPPAAVEPPPPPPPPPKVVEGPPPPPPPPPAQPKVDEIALLQEQETARLKAEQEAAAKAAADAAAKQKEIDDAKRAEIARKKREDDKRRQAELNKKKREDDAKKKAEADAKKRADVIAAGIAGASEGPKPELLDKDPTKKAGGGATPSPVPTKTAAKGPTAGSPKGNATVNTANDAALLVSMINQALKPCWRLPTAGGDSRSIPSVKLAWRMRPNGTVEGEPRVLQKENSPIGSLAADAAMRAVITCAFTNLPPDKYALWRDIEWDFDPRRAQ